MSDRGRRDDPGFEELLALARKSMGRAYAPYSGFPVGAALEAEDGRRFGGCNVESAAYPVGACAERVALGTAVTEGARRFRRLVLVTGAERPASPCGMCRQALSEFGTELEVVSVAADGARRNWRLAELLPESFTLRPEVRP